MEPLQAPPVPMMTHPLNENNHRPLPPSPVSRLPSQSPTNWHSVDESQPWFITPAATPLPPLTYSSEPDVSCGGLDREEMDSEKIDVSTSITELKLEPRESSPESYLEYNHKPEQSPPPPPALTAEDPYWYRHRDSTGRSEQLEIESLPMPYETVVNPPTSPERSVKWKDMDETDAQLQSMASPYLSAISHSLRAEEEGKPSHITSRTEASNLGQHPTEQPHQRIGRRVSDGNFKPPPPLPGMSHNFQRPPTISSYHNRPSMLRTLSDNLPHHNLAHHHTHRSSETLNNQRNTPERAFPIPPSSQISQTGSAYGASCTHSSLQRQQLPLRLVDRGETTFDSHSNSQRGRGSTAATLGATSHSNGPSVEHNTNYIIQ